MAFNNFPYTNFHELNADWMLETLKTLRNNVEAAIQSMESVLGSLEEYNQRLSNLEAGAVLFTEAQEKTEAERATARSNIGAIGTQDLNSAAVRYDRMQTLTDEQRVTARGNIEAAPLRGTVRYDAAQYLDDSYKARARTNIAALGLDDLDAHAVRYDVEQQLTDAQQQTARENIGAPAVENGAVAGPIIADTSRIETRSGVKILTVYGPVNALSLHPIANGTVDHTTYCPLYVGTPTNTRHAATKAYVDGASVDVTGSNAAIAANANTEYKCGTLTSLAINSYPNTGSFSIVFTSGATATHFVPVPGIKGLEAFQPAANTLYEINVKDLRAVIGYWGVS